MTGGAQNHNDTTKTDRTRGTKYVHAKWRENEKYMDTRHKGSR